MQIMWIINNLLPMKKGIEEQDKKYIIILKNVETKLNMF